MLPLGDLIRDLDVRLVAGEAGLENAVRWVHISELEDPTPDRKSTRLNSSH